MPANSFAEYAPEPNPNLAQALSDCDQAYRLRPNDGYTLASRGFVYLRLGRLDDAIVELRCGGEAFGVHGVYFSLAAESQSNARAIRPEATPT